MRFNPEERTVLLAFPVPSGTTAISKMRPSHCSQPDLVERDKKIVPWGLKNTDADLSRLKCLRPPCPLILLPTTPTVYFGAVAPPYFGNAGEMKCFTPAGILGSRKADSNHRCWILRAAGRGKSSATIS